MKTASIRGSAVILELKSVNEYGKLEAGCRQALEQISSQRYVEGLQKEGYQNILAYGICYYKKEYRVEKTRTDI